MKGYEIKVRLDEFRPITWRNLIVPEGISFADLDKIIKVVYGFSNQHLSAFYTRKSNFQIADPSFELRAVATELDSNVTCIDEFFKSERKIDYVYDFSDWWSFTIEIGKTVDYKRHYPTINRFRGDYNPLEDCGGISAFEKMLFHKDDLDENEIGPDESPYHLQKFNIDSTQAKLKNLM